MSYETAKQEFLHPADEFTPIPFWFWNDELTEETLLRQIEDFDQKGVKGFVIHPRKGLPLTIPYLSQRYLHFVRFAVEEAARRGMRVVLYDEAMYPSGAAHGMVAAENPEWASRCLTMETANTDIPDAPDIVAVCAAHVVAETAHSITLVARENGVYACPKDGRVLLCFRFGFSGGTIRGVHPHEDDGEENAPRSADLLNPEAVQAFIRLTHEAYYAALPEHFGKTVIAFFTDEPDITGRNAKPGCKAWTKDFLTAFGPREDLPALWLDVGEKTQEIRTRYRRAVNARLKESYYQQLADWCAAHGIALTGHPAKGWDIGLLAPFQIPAQDVVWRFVHPGNGISGAESVLAKCSADRARLDGRRRNGNECFGCCGPAEAQWAMTMDDMKWYMDYLFVRGVNLLYPHAFFYSLRDGRGDERPPDVGLNNLWWPMYDRVAMYMRRLSWLMTDSEDMAQVAVLCEEDSMPWENCIPLYENQIGFHYLPQTMVKTHGARYAYHVSGEAQIAALPRDVRLDAACPALRTAHVRKLGLDYYLLVNEGEEAIQVPMQVDACGAAYWWNAWTGEISEAATDAQGKYHLTLPRRESIILCIDPASAPHEAQAVTAHVQTKTVLSGCAWTLTRQDTGESVVLTADEQGCLPGWETFWPSYSGWVRYEADIPCTTHAAQLVLESVTGMVTLDMAQPWQCWAPYRLDVPAGESRLSFLCCNTMANQLDNKAWSSGVTGAILLCE